MLKLGNRWFLTSWGRLHSIETHWTFPILVGRSCQREIGTCTALRRDATHCFRDFEADTLPKYNTLIIPTPTKLSCDGQLYWDRNYSADIVRRGSLLQQQVPLKAFVFRGEMRSHQESGINQTDYLFIATWERNSQALTLESDSLNVNLKNKYNPMMKTTEWVKPFHQAHSGKNSSSKVKVWKIFQPLPRTEYWRKTGWTGGRDPSTSGCLCFWEA